MSNNIFDNIRQFSEMTIIRRLQVIVYLFLVGGIFTMIFWSYFEGMKGWIVISALGFIVAIVPLILQKWIKIIVLPYEVHFVIALALFLHIVGNVVGFYSIFSWYDTIAHFVGSATAAVIAFLAIVIIDKYVESIRMSRYSVLVFVVLFTTAVGCYWEVVEFFSDEVYNTRYQFGNNDTMLDLISDILAGIVVGCITTLYLKYTPMDRFVKDAIRKDRLETLVGKLQQEIDKLKDLTST